MSGSNSFTPVDPNPYASPQDPSVLAERPVPPGSRAGHVVDYLAIWLLFLTCAVGAVAAFVEIESILYSGALATILAGFVVARGWRLRNWMAGVLFGTSVVTVSLATMIVINLFGWSPTDAVAHKVPHVLALYAFTTPVLAYFAHKTLRRRGDLRPD